MQCYIVAPGVYCIIWLIFLYVILFAIIYLKLQHIDIMNLSGYLSNSRWNGEIDLIANVRGIMLSFIAICRQLEINFNFASPY